MIPVSCPSLGQEEIQEIQKVFQTRWLGLGSAVFEFEKKVREYLGAAHVIAVNTGTSALHIALDAFGIGRGDEVIVPSLTFCASIQAITALGAAPVFCEVSPRTLNIDIPDAEKRITGRTKAIMPVHYCGNACDMDSLLDLGERHNLIIIEDAAHAFGSSYKGKKIGGFGDVACFSFDPIKTITCGEGGAVVLADNDIAEEIRRKRTLGINKDGWHRHGNEGSWFYEVTTQGYRCHMSNISAAIGLAQFKKLGAFVEKKRRIVKLYNDRFEKLEGVKILEWNLDETAPFAYMVRVPADKRQALMDFLRERGVGTGIHYIANHIQPFFAPYNKPLPVTDGIWKEILTLPLYYDMAEADIDLVIASVTGFFER